MGIRGIDHVSLPTRDVEGLAAFYSGLGVVVDGLEEWQADERMVVSLLLGEVKIHLHTPRMLEHVGEPWFVRADVAVPGCGDLCFEWLGGVPRSSRTWRTSTSRSSRGPCRAPVGATTEWLGV